MFRYVIEYKDALIHMIGGSNFRYITTDTTISHINMGEIFIKMLMENQEFISVKPVELNPLDVQTWYVFDKELDKCKFLGDIIFHMRSHDLMMMAKKYDFYRISTRKNLFLNRNITRVYAVNGFENTFKLHLNSNNSLGFTDIIYLRWVKSVNYFIISNTIDFYEYMHIIFIERKIPPIFKNHFNDISIITYKEN